MSINNNALKTIESSNQGNLSLDDGNKDPCNDLKKLDKVLLILISSYSIENLGFTSFPNKARLINFCRTE